MKPSPPKRLPVAAPRVGAAGFVAALLGVALLAAYSNTFRVPFLFDDIPAIVENPALRDFSLLSLIGVGHAGGLTTSGRPVLAFSLAVNRAVGGDSVGGYHLTNWFIHLVASLCLFGIVRRTLLKPRLASRFGAAATPIAAIAAVLWALHPIQTESVTYIVQRAESLAGLFYLLVLYSFIRGSESPYPRKWWVCAFVACLLGVGSKEIVATAPILVWLYDRAFVSGSFRAAWQRHRRLYLALISTWIVFIGLLAATAGRGGTAGFGTEMTAWSYALTQSRAIMRYLGLSIWPAALTFDYGTATAGHLSDVFPQLVAVLALVLAAAWAFIRWPTGGFLGISFFFLLAPSSSFVPIVTQTMAEHRMYLPLAALLVLLVALIYYAIGRFALLGLAVAVVAEGISTWNRNADYVSEISIWQNTASRYPTNARAHNNWGRELFRLGQTENAIVCYRRALELQPRYPETHYNMAVALASKAELNAAVDHYSTALRLEPEYAEAHNNLGNALVALGRATEATTHYQRAIGTRPGFAEAHNNLGNAFLQLGRTNEAQNQIRQALQLKPDYPEAHYNLGNALAAAGDMRGACEEYQQALRQNAGYVEAMVNLGNAHLALDEREAALKNYEKAVALNPAQVDALFNLASVLLDLDRWDEASARLEKLLQLNPRYAPAHRALAYAFAKLGRRAPALAHYETYLALVPGDIDARREAEALRKDAAPP